MLRTLIVDDMALARQRLARHLESDPDVTIVGECSGGQEAIEAIRELRPDVVFLDVQMPEVGGFDVLEAVGPAAVPVVVFVTAYDQFALRAFEVNAVDYLLKPFDAGRLAAAVDRVKRQLRTRQGDATDARLTALLQSIASRQRPQPRLALKVDGRVVLVPTSDIDYVEAAGNYVRIIAGGESHMIRERLSQMETQLDPGTFVRVHRSTIVNVTRIKEMYPLFNGDQSLVLRSGKRITMSRTFRERMLAVLANP